MSHRPGPGCRHPRVRRGIPERQVTPGTQDAPAILTPKEPHHVTLPRSGAQRCDIAVVPRAANVAGKQPERAYPHAPRITIVGTCLIPARRDTPVVLSSQIYDLS